MRERCSIRPPIGQIVIVEDPGACAIEIVILAASKRPEKGPQSQKAKAQRNGDQVNQNRHDASLASDRGARVATGWDGSAARIGCDARNADSVTMIDEPDIAAAAISGVTCPNTASGTAIRL